MKIIDENAYYVLTSDKNKKKILQEAFKSGDKVYHAKYGAGEFVRFDDAYFYMAHVNFESGEHVVTALELEGVKLGQVQPVKVGSSNMNNCNTEKDENGVCSHLWGEFCGVTCCRECSEESCNSRCASSDMPVKGTVSDAGIQTVEVQEQVTFTKPGSSMVEIPINHISLSGWNPRKNFEPEALEELKKSIQEHGILEPLIVRPINGPNNTFISFELVAGERRYRAAKELGIKNVPAVIRRLSNHDVREIMLIENLQRSSLEPLEEAEALEVILSDEVTTQEELAKKLGKSQSWIANRLRLLKAPDELKKMIISREITPKHVISLLPLTEYPVLKEKIIPEIKRLQQYSEVSVRQVENLTENAIQGDHDATAVLQLNDFPWDREKYREFFDFSQCFGVAGSEKVPVVCGHLHVVKQDDVDPEELEEGEEPPEDDKYCLNRRCWADKLNIAKQKWEKTQAMQKSRSKQDGEIIDTSKMQWGTYENLSRGFDETECKTCKNNRKNQRGEPVCIDPACYDKKQSAHQRELNKKAREEDRKAWELLDSRITNLTALSDKTARWVMENSVEYAWMDAAKAGLAPWCKVKRGEDIDFKTIPQQDTYKALVRLIVARVFVNRKATVGHMEKILKAMGV